MKKFYFYAALIAGTALTSCTSEDDLALSPPEVNVEDAYAPIVFNSLKNNITRADITGKAAADSLGNQFVVFGYKGAKTGEPGGEGSIVFDNYLVKYMENTANTTESNSSNWEYVLENKANEIPIKHAVDNHITKQTIKYWDYSKDQYDFIAWSTGKKKAIYEMPTGGIPAGSVLVSEIAATAATSGTGLANAYTFEGAANDLKDCYIADLVTVKKGDAGTYGETSGYNKPVTLRFRQLGTKVRMGIYETVPGYSVKNVKFYKHGGLLTATTAGTTTTPAILKEGQIVDSATIFSQGSDIYTKGKYTVYFPTVDKPDSIDNNQAHITFDSDNGEKTTIVNWGKLNYTIRESGEKDEGKVYLGRTSNTATYAGDSVSNFYVFYLPNETGTNLNLRVDFTLESIDGSGEIIEVKNAKAQVPSIYTTWKPGFAYTYLFKISDKTNGRTGVYDPTQADDATINSDPAGLYPITFDAVVVNAEDGNSTQETITLIATPSITTYQQNSTVVNADEYKVNGKDIFVTVDNNNNDNNVNLITLTGHAGLYALRTSMTEAEVIDALTYQDDDAEAKTIKGRSGKVLDSLDCVTGANDLTAANTWMLTDTVKFGADGNAIKVGTDQALRFKPQAGKTYAFVYEETLKTKDSLIYQALAFDQFNGRTRYRYQYKDAQAGDVQKDSTYFNANGSAKTVFLGQTVNNLYVDKAGTAASGYAKTNTKYYYTLDGGQSYIEAHNVNYSATWYSGLYEIDTTAPEGYKQTTDNGAIPINGKAYYYKDGNDYIYCVFLPEQADNLKVLDTTKYEVAEETSAITGQTYFDMYKKNDAVRYVKVIKVAAE